MRRLLAVIAVVPLLAGCSKKDSCSVDEEKQAALDTARSWYLYQELLPAEVDVAAYGSAAELLRALTAPARAQGVERDGWTWVMTRAAYDQHYVAARSAGFGFTLRGAGTPPALRLRVAQVFAGSAAARAGFVRGDELLAVGPDETSLVDLADAAAPGALVSPGGVAGVTRVFRVLPRGQTVSVLRTMTSAAFDLDPVPSHRILDGGTTGYVQVRTFITPAEPALRSAFAAFRAAGVRDVIVDLRYNGGGAVATAQVLGSLLSADRVGETMFEMRFNDKHRGEDQRHAFAAEPAAGTFRRVAFLVTRGSASASELVPNALDAYRTRSTIAYVGDRTAGKPVGQRATSLGDCDEVIAVVAFKAQNAAGNAGYFDGLPDESSHAPLCPAEDDLAHEQDDPAEAMTAAARYFVEHGECPPAPAVQALREPVRMQPLRMEPLAGLAGAETTPAAIDMPGTF